MIADRAAKDKVKHILFGMPHRGRLNTLACVFWKPLE
jgi:2-oxoglutarate dehydrogenase complex dehydrogenase (E1) component-like enzyme